MRCVYKMYPHIRVCDFGLPTSLATSHYLNQWWPSLYIRHSASMSQVDNVIFYNCICILFHWRAVLLYAMLCCYYISQHTVQFSIGKYANHNSYVDFFVKLAKGFWIKKCSMHSMYVQSPSGVILMLWISIVPMHEILPQQLIIWNWKLVPQIYSFNVTKYLQNTCISFWWILSTFD